MKYVLKLFLPCIVMAYSFSGLAQSETSQGIVAETLESGGYTYILLEESGMWIAAPKMAVSKGDQIEYFGGMEMPNFYSKTLDRTFESIWFIQSVKIADDEKAKLNNEVVDAHGISAHGPASGQVDAPKPGEITRLEEGKTINEIYSELSSLGDEAVSLRAKVVKVNTNIMGKNWITLQDGSGESPNDQLIATSLETVSAGETVIVSGKISTNVDLGYGYNYKVLMEDATFSQN